jgi:hypothetical protein
MFSTPFCQHQFTKDQLDALEWVVCPCGYHYRSKNLIRYAEKFAAYNQARTEIEALVAEITTDHSSRQANQATPSAPTTATYAPAAKPQRQRATISVSQWLIISASILVLIAASVFVQGARQTWGPVAWLILEAVLGAAAFVGTLFSRKLSVLLSNFLAVFSAGMLMSLIMTAGTQLNLGFSEFDKEPAWYWAINLGLVSAASTAASLKYKNFGWRALSPITLTISGLLLTYGAVGEAIRATPNAFAWQLISLSFTAIALLTQLRYLRQIKQTVDPKSENREYEEDLHKREDGALQRFASFTTIFLAVIGTGFTLVQLLTNVGVAFDPIATVSLGALWLLGSSTIDFWGTSLSRTGEVSRGVKTATWTLAYVSIGVGVNALLVNQNTWVSMLVSLAATLALTTLPRYARFVKPPMITLSATGWSIFLTWAIWTLDIMNQNDRFALGIYLFGFALVTVAADLITKSRSNNLLALLATSASSLLLATSWHTSFDSFVDSWFFAGAGVLVTLVIANFSSLTSNFLSARTKTAKPEYLNWVTLPVGVVASLVWILSVTAASGDRRLGLLSAIGAYLLWAVGAQLLNHRKSATTRDLQALAAFIASVFLTVIAGSDSRFNTFTGLVFAGFAVTAYAFGYLEKRPIKLQLGLTGALVGLFAGLHAAIGVEYSALALNVRFALLFALLPILVVVHNFVIRRRTDISSAANAATNLAVLLVGSALSPLLVFVGQSESNWVWAFLALGLAVFALLEVRRVSSDQVNAFQLRLAGTGYLAIGLINVWLTSSSVDGDANHLRQLVFSLILVATGWRTLTQSRNINWAAASYLGSIIFAVTAGDWLHRQPNLHWDGPEMTSAILAALLAINGWVANKALGKARLWLISDVPVFVAVLPSLAFAFTQNLEALENVTRLLAVGAILAGYGYWRALQSRNVAWTPLGYAGAALAALMVVQEFKVGFSLDLRGPELYSIAVMATTFVGTKIVRKLVALKGSLLTWGLPLAVAIAPSAIYSYGAITSPFASLNSLEVSRVIAVLAISAAALVIGIRAGNLGAASVGTIGLTLAAVPNLWFRFDGVAEGNTTAELRALLLGGFIFLLLAVTKKFEFIKGNSVVFIGIPATIALAPAVLNTVSALSHPSFLAIDWWRFAIVLSISLTLLVVGAMRELGGMFYPGFAGVLVAALPYGFKQIEGAAWLLWIILLLVAATLIWVAMRIEKMRKLGRTPAMWLRELK